MIVRQPGWQPHVVCPFFDVSAAPSELRAHTSKVKSTRDRVLSNCSGQRSFRRDTSTWSHFSFQRKRYWENWIAKNVIERRWRKIWSEDLELQGFDGFYLVVFTW